MRTERHQLGKPDEQALAERDRLEALDRFDILDSAPESAFDRIARLVQTIYDVPIAVVSMIDAHRQWYKACEGLSPGEAARKDTFCRYTIEDKAPWVVEDAKLDLRVANNPHVLGEPHVRFYAGVPLLTDDGQAIGSLCAIDLKPRSFGEREIAILTDLAAVVMEQLELRLLVAHDVLTGVLSRRAFKEAATRAIALTQRHKTNLSLIMFDLDYFKAVNDEFGHAAGDEVLSNVGLICTETLRTTDRIGRIGGEEFAVILPNTHRHGALEVAEKLRSAIEAADFRLRGFESKITASFGIATLDLETTDVEGLLAHADAALYQAKAAGRNRCVAWRGDEKSVGQPRRRVLKAGLIVTNNRMSTVDCTVRTLSQQGAGLDMSSSFGLPEQFRLQIRSDSFESACRIVSQTERHVEVEFC